VNKDARRSIRVWIYGGSVALHAALALGTVLLPAEQKTESVAIELADIRKKNEKPKPLPPPPPPPPKEKLKPPPPPPPKEQAKVAPEPVKEEAPPPEPLAADGFADLGGVSLGNGPGAGGGAEGVAVAAAARPGAAAGTDVHPQKAVTHKVQELDTTGAVQCTEPLVKPKHKTTVKPVYTLQARQAEIEGVVRVEVTVDENGRVLSARVLSGLGYGLDESALDAAKGWTFQPATRCGKPLVGTIVIPFRFDLT
jgi:protein TonB